MINISIEPTDYCNASCYYCIVGIKNQPHLKRGGYLPLEVHDQFLDNLKLFLNDPVCAPVQDKGVYLRYCGIGEPTLHKDFLKMFRKGLSSPEVKALAILSNGSGWDNKFTDSFLKITGTQSSKPVELIFSLDTLSPETQFKIKKMKNIKQITKQIIYLLNRIKENHYRNIHPVLQMIILEENIKEVKQFTGFWKKEISRAGLSSCIVYDPSYGKYFSKTDCFIWLKCRDTDSCMQKKFIKLHELALKKAGINISRPIKQVGLTNPEEPEGGREQSEFKFPHVCSMLWYGMNIAANVMSLPAVLILILS